MGLPGLCGERWGSCGTVMAWSQLYPQLTGVCHRWALPSIDVRLSAQSGQLPIMRTGWEIRSSLYFVGLGPITWIKTQLSFRTHSCLNFATQFSNQTVGICLSWEPMEEYCVQKGLYMGNVWIKVYILVKITYTEMHYIRTWLAKWCTLLKAAYQNGYILLVIRNFSLNVERAQSNLLCITVINIFVPFFCL